MKYLVAKSYEELPIVEEEYTKNGRTYCKVLTKKGVAKEVRTYTQEEWNKLYSVITPKKSAGISKWKSQRELLGFGEKGFIFVFNNAPKFEEFYEKGPFRYSRWTGWYLPSNETVPTLPEGIVSKTLPWEVVGMDNGELKEEKQLLKDFSNFIRTN